MGKTKSSNKTRTSVPPPIGSRLVDVADQFLLSLLEEGSFQHWIDSSSAFHEFVYQVLPFLKLKFQERVLTALLHDNKAATVSQAAERLVKLKESWAQELLDRELRNGSVEVRCAILQALASTERRFALPRFIRACDDPHIKVKEIACAYVSSDRDKLKPIEKVVCGKCKKTFSKSELQRHIEHAHTPIRDAARKNIKKKGQSRAKSSLKAKLDEIDKSSRNLRGDPWEWDMTTPNTLTYRRGR